MTRFLRECLRAHVARERTLASVRALMPHKVLVFGKRFRARIALILADIVVHGKFVSAHGALRGKGRRTLVAREWLATGCTLAPAYVWRKI